MSSISKILIANRGEIALRIMRTATQMGIKTIALFALDEEEALHVKQADEAFCLGSGTLNGTYLNIEKIIDIAKRSSADAIHPGYGFLSENADFARACADAGITFVGPSAEALKTLGNKVEAKKLAASIGVPILESISVQLASLNGEANNFEYPLLIKASHGGGGKGMQVVKSSASFYEKAEQAARAALSYFGNEEIYIEKYIPLARHIEVQVLGDQHGNLIHLYDRDCSLQRNHQKIVEEAPAPNLPYHLREELVKAALDICQEVAYTNAGTVEFLIDENDNFYFLEMNPRIQVEHTVTEQITGLDIVREQMRIANGESISVEQKDVVIRGSSIQVRIYAEDPTHHFRPSALPVTAFSFPEIQNLRVESHLSNASGTVSQFDPLLVKLISSGESREEAIAKMKLALQETHIWGPTTNQSYLHEIIRSLDFRTKIVSTRYCEENHDKLLQAIDDRQKKTAIEKILGAAVLLKYVPFEVVDSGAWLQHDWFRPTMKNEVNIDGRKVEFSLSTHQNEYEITTDTEILYLKEIARNGNRLSFRLNEEQVELAFAFSAQNRLVFDVAGIQYKVHCTDFLEEYAMEGTNENMDFAQDWLVRSPLFGKVVDIKVQETQAVNKGDVLLIIESMKSENLIRANSTGIVHRIHVGIGHQVNDKMVLVEMEEVKNPIPTFP